MTAEKLSAALEREHREIDAGIETYTAVAGTEESLAALRRAIAGLRRHIYLEEEFIFPTLQKSGLVPPVFVMLREHGELWRTMQTVDEALAADSGSEAATTACHKLLGQLAAHNDKEEPIIYPQADAKLDEQAQTELFTFLETGTTPDGWVCAKA